MTESYNREEIESRVICDAIMAPETIADNRSIINPSMFTVKEYADLWKELVRSWDNGHPQDANIILEVKDTAARSKLMLAIPHAGMVIGSQSNARTLRYIHADNIVLDFANFMTKEVARGLVDPSFLLTEARRLVASLEKCHQSRRAVRLDDAVGELEEQIHNVKESRDKGELPFIPTGFIHLDHYFRGGLRGGNVMVMAARPGVGKTSSLLAMITAIVKAGKKVRFYSMEMPATEIAERIMFGLGGMKPWMLSTGDLEQDVWNEAREQCREWGLWIEDSMNNISDILSDATVYHQRGECDIIFLDHLRLLRTGDPKLDSNIYMRTCEITRQIKVFSLNTMTPVVYACQLNRDSVREDRDPDLQDLRDSGSIEEDADKLVFLRRMKTVDDKLRLKMIIGKNRQGGGVYEHTYLIPNETFSAFVETDAEGDLPPSGPSLDDADL